MSNARRVAEIHQEIAKLHQELAEELAPPAEGAVEEKPARKRARVHPAPLHEPNEIDVQRARNMLRRRGMTT